MSRTECSFRFLTPFFFLGCYAPRVPASGLIVVGGLAVAGFMTTAISAGLGEHRFAGWAWLTTCSAAVVFAFLAAFFLVRYKQN